MNARYESTLPEVPKPSRLRAGALAFAALTVGGLVGVFVIGGRDGASPRFDGMQVGFLVAAVASALADVVLGGLRIQIFIRRIHPRSPFSLPIRADLAGRFLSAVTPSPTGGGPAQVYFLRKGGVPVPEALALLLVNMIATLLVLLLAGVLSAWHFRDHLGEGALLRLLRVSLFVMFAVLGMAVAALLRPDLVARPLARLARRLDRGHRSSTKLLARVARLLVDSLEQYRVACHRFVRECPWLPVASLALTALLYLNKFFLAWLVIRGLGIEIDSVTTLAALALAQIGMLLVPTPGGSGIGELVTGAFVSTLLPGPLVGPFTLVYRLLLVYLPAMAGAFLVLGELGARPGRRLVRVPPVMAPVLVIAVSVGAAAIAGADGRCPLCCDGAPVATPIPRSEIDAAARRLAEQNRRQLGRIDSLLRVGRFGAPGSHEARARAQLLARTALANWYSFLLPYVGDLTRVHSLAPEVIAPVAARYCEALAVPMPRLRELRLGHGHVCARYDLAGSGEEGWTIFGGRRLRFRVGDRAVGPGVRRVLGLDWPAGDKGKLELLVEEHYGFRLARTEVDEDGHRSQLFLALDVAGGWVRRHGVHRPAGFAFWTTPPTDDTPPIPGATRVGAVIYVPGLCFRLPLLPDVELDDVRALDLPMPFLDAADLNPGLLPSWLPLAGEAGLFAWTGEGAPPSAIRGYFPERRRARDASPIAGSR